MIFIKKSTPFRHKRYHGCYECFYKVILFVIQASVMQLPIIMKKAMVLKILIHTIAKRHVVVVVARCCMSDVKNLTDSISRFSFLKAAAGLDVAIYSVTEK